MPSAGRPLRTNGNFTTRTGTLVRAQGYPPHADRFARHGIDLVGLLAGGRDGG